MTKKPSENPAPKAPQAPAPPAREDEKKKLTLDFTDVSESLERKISP